MNWDQYASGEQYMGWDDYLNRSDEYNGWDKYLHQDFKGPELPKEDRPNPMIGLADLIDQAILGYAQMRTFNIAGGLGSVEPKTTAEAIARGAGQFGGFIHGPMSPMSVGSKIAKPFTEAAGTIGRVTMGEKLGNLVEFGASRALPLAAAEGLTSMGENVGAGAQTGLEFAATQMIAPKNNIVGFILRQVGGRAIQAVMGKYNTEMFDQQHLAQTVWHEALNTWFFSHGISPKEVLTGEFKNPQNKKMHEQIVKAIDEHNRVTAEEFNRKISIFDYAKAPTKEIEVKDILVDPSKLSQKEINELEISLDKDPTLHEVYVDWDPGQGKYVSPNNNNLLQAYINRRFSDKRLTGETKPMSVKVKVRIDKADAPIKLDKPSQAVLKYLSDAYGTNLTSDLLVQAENAQYAIWDAKANGGKGGVIRVMPFTVQARGEQALEPWQVMFHYANGKATTVAAGKSIAPYILTATGKKGARVPTSGERGRELSLRDEIERLQSEIKIDTARNMMDTDKVHRLKVAKGEVESMEGQRIPEQAMLKGYTGKVKTETGVKFNIEKGRKQVVSVFDNLRKFPKKNAGSQYEARIQSVLDKLGMGGWKTDSFLTAIDAKSEGSRLKVENVPHTEDVISALATLKDQAARHAYIGTIMLRESSIKIPELKEGGELWRDQIDVETNTLKARHAYWAKMEKLAKEDPSGGSAIKRMLVINMKRALEDVRYAFMDIEEKTGIPLYTIHRALADGRAAKWAEQSMYEERLQPFLRMPTEDQITIRKYFFAKYMRDDAAVELEASMSPRAAKMVETLTQLFKDMEPDIIRYRFRVYYDSTVVPRHMGLKPKSGLVFKRQNEPEVQALLDMGSAAWGVRKLDGGKSFEGWVENHARPARLGLIEEGRYLPMEILGIKPGNIERNTLLWHVDTMGHGRMESRGKIGDRDMEDILVQQAYDKDLVIAVKNYVSQVLNLKHLSEGMDALNKVAEAYPEMATARRTGFMRKGPESRAYTTLEYLKLYAMRMKGYPVKLSAFESALKDVQLHFFRALVVRPSLWLRNLFQATVNFPSKKFLDPRFTKYQFSKLPENVQRWLHTKGIDDSDAFSHSYLELETNLRLARIPVAGKIWEIAGKLGEMYARTDTWNRKFVYTTSWFRSKFYADKYKSGEISYEKLRNALDIDKMKGLEQKEFKAVLENKSTEEAAFVVARWQTENSQWKYSRYERGLEEMTGGGESLSNLFTWSKSMVQHVANTAGRFADAAKRYSYARDPYARSSASRQMLHSGSEVVGLALAGAVANLVYEAVTVSHGSRFQAYGADMFTWQFGGVTGEILTEFTNKTSNLVSAYGSGDEGAKKRAVNDWVKMADNVGIRQLIPFSKHALSIVESLTDASYVSPLYSLQGKFSSGYWRGIETVDRTLLEGFTHAIFTSDPNKTEDVRKYTFQKLNDLRGKEFAATGAMKSYYSVLVKRYEYLNDLFMRYQPIDVQREMYENERRGSVDEAISKMEMQSYRMEKKRYEHSF